MDRPSRDGPLSVEQPVATPRLSVALKKAEEFRGEPTTPRCVHDPTSSHAQPGGAASQILDTITHSDTHWSSVVGPSA